MKVIRLIRSEKKTISWILNADRHDLFHIKMFTYLLLVYYPDQQTHNIVHTIVQALRLCTGRTAHRGSRGIALSFHDHGTRRGWRVSVTPRSLFTPWKDPVPICRRLGGPQGRSGQLRKILPPPGFDCQTIQPVASRYTDWAVLVHIHLRGDSLFIQLTGHIDQVKYWHLSNVISSKIVDRWRSLF